MVNDKTFKYDSVCSERKNANENESNPISKQQREQGCLLKKPLLFIEPCLSSFISIKVAMNSQAPFYPNDAIVLFVSSAFILECY